MFIHQILGNWQIQSNKGDHVIPPKIIHAKTASDLFSKINSGIEKLPSVTELMVFRTRAFEDVLGRFDGRELLFQDQVSLETRIKFAVHILHEFGSDEYKIWRFRLTTSTNMVHADGKVFFYDGNPFENYNVMANSMRGELSDGGIRYDKDAMKKIISNTPESRVLSFEDYLKSKGGNFTSDDLAEHPVFSRSCSDAPIFRKYLSVLDLLSLTDFYHHGVHSAWRPGEIKEGFGRPFALGYKGDAFYPPNNNTLGHAAIVIPL